MFFRTSKRGLFHRVQWSRNGKAPWTTVSLGKCSSASATDVVRLLHKGVRVIPDLPPMTAMKLASAGFLSEIQSTDLDDFLDCFMHVYEAGKSANTVRNMRQTVRLLKQYFGKCDIDSISIEGADQWYAWRASAAAPTTLGREVKRVKQIFSKAVLTKAGFKNCFPNASANNEER